MAEIVRGYDEWGERLVWWVEWEASDGCPEERYFKTKREAETFAIDVETDLLLQAVESFNSMWTQMSVEERMAFNERLRKEHARAGDDKLRKLK